MDDQFNDTDAKGINFSDFKKTDKPGIGRMQFYFFFAQYCPNFCTAFIKANGAAPKDALNQENKYLHNTFAVDRKKSFNFTYWRELRNHSMLVFW
jgi:hypothetical protein